MIIYLAIVAIAPATVALVFSIIGLRRRTSGSAAVANCVMGISAFVALVSTIVMIVLIL